MKSKFEKSKTKHEYNPGLIEPKWQKNWEKEKIYSPNLDKAKHPFYNLMMFPYPSADGMHVGNMYAFTGADVYSRFMRMQGFDVFEPIGLDGFGIHSENYAIKIGRHPKEQAKISEKNFYRQLRATGNGFDWSRKLETYDPKYYKWTQWLFIQLFKAGLAYRKKAPVNFCPSCKTVLADEQVVQKVKGQSPIQSGTKVNPFDKLSFESEPEGSSLRVEDRVDAERSRSIKTTTQKSKVEETVAVCERCETEVYKKELEQWFFRITKYADRLLANIKKLDWTEKVKIAQKQWIGKKEGINIEYKLKDNDLKIVCFTTTPVNFAATFIVLAPEHPLVFKIIKKEKLNEVKSYISKAKSKNETERIAAGREKTGVFTGSYCINHVTGKEIPIWVSDFVLMDVGTGAIQGCPGHDIRDFEFAKKFGLPIVRVIVGSDGDESEITRAEQVIERGGVMVNSDFLNGIDFYEAMEKTKDYFEKKGWGKRVVTYHLRDWLISRQRYWGPPIPMIFCQSCAKKGNSGFSFTKKSSVKEDYLVNLKADSLSGWPDTLESNISKQNKNVNSDWDSAGWFPVPEKELPVLLPDVKDWKPTGTGKSPLASVESFVNTKCPNCKSLAKRETDVSDTFLDSSWYFFRYTSNDIDSTAFDIKRAKKWLPVEMYIGGAEHSVLHLLYSRFITMALKDLKLIDFEEPFSRFYAHGLLIKEGAKMSKSKGNVVVPDMYIKKYGADTLRCYLMFLGPFSQGGDFYDTGIEGMNRFRKRVWNLVLSIKHNVSSINSQSTKLDRVMNKTIKLVTDDLERLHYNTAIARIMEYYNTLHRFYTEYKILNTKYCKTLVLLLAPFAPHMTEELYQTVILSPSTSLRAKDLDSSQASPDQNDKKWSIHLQPWPTYDPKFLQEDEVTIVVQVNGKLRETIRSQKSKVKSQKYIEELSKESERVKKYLEGKIVKRIVYVEGKVINFVTNQ